MSGNFVTKAEQHFFDPAGVVEFGIDERCANCPVLNHDLQQRAIHLAFTGEADLSTSGGRHLAERRDEEEARLKSMAASCSGHEELSGDELDAYVAAHNVEDGLDRESVVVGYRCRATGHAVVAITWGNGVVGLSPVESQTPEFGA